MCTILGMAEASAKFEMLIVQRKVYAAMVTHLRSIHLEDSRIGLKFILHSSRATILSVGQGQL